MNWEFEDGIARASIYPTGPEGEPWVPAQDRNERFDPLPQWSPTIVQILRIKGVEEVGSCGAQSYHVIVRADSIEELPTAVAHVKAQLQRLFVRAYERHQTRATPAPKGPTR